MSGADPSALLDVAREAVAAGAEVAVDWWRRLGALAREEKRGPGDLVSQADRDAEDAIRAVLARRRPDDTVVGEEAGAEAGTSGLRWFVDPIDGTVNYLYGRPDWSVSVGVVDDDGTVLAGVVAEPTLGRSTWAARGLGAANDLGPLPAREPTELQRALLELNLGRGPQRPRTAQALTTLAPRVRAVRRGGSAASALVQVADGRADAAWLPGLAPWDCAGGLVVAAESGAEVGDLAAVTGARLPAADLAAGVDVLAAAPGLHAPLVALLAPHYAAG